MPNYFAFVWYSVGITAVICAGVSVAALIFVVPNIVAIERSHFARLLDKHREAGRWKRVLLWAARIVWLVLQVAGVAALAVSFAAMCAAAIHAAINFAARATHSELATLLQDEVSEGTLALRWASISLFVTWMWMARGHVKRAPRRDQLDDRDGTGAEYLAAVRAAWASNASNERTWFSSDNAARKALQQVAFYMPAAHIFFYHTLHLGLISLAVTFTWIMLAAVSDAWELKLLAWLTLFASHDIGLVFGYVYVLKGRILGPHRARIYASGIGLIILMLIAAQRNITPFGLNVGLLLAILAVLAVLVAVGIAVFEAISVQATSRHKGAVERIVLR